MPSEPPTIAARWALEIALYAAMAFVFFKLTDDWSFWERVGFGLLIGTALAAVVMAVRRARRR